MSVLDTINNILSATPNHQLDPSDFLIRCTKILDEACTVGGEFDPREEPKSVNACNAYGSVSQLFLENGLTFAAESLLIDAWNKFGLIQFNEKQRIYTGSSRNQAGEIEFLLFFEQIHSCTPPGKFSTF